MLVQPILTYPSYLLVVVCRSVKKDTEGEQQQQQQRASTFLNTFWKSCAL